MKIQTQQNTRYELLKTDFISNVSIVLKVQMLCLQIKIGKSSDKATTENSRNRQRDKEKKHRR